MKTPTIEQHPEVVVIPMKRTFLSLLLCFAIALSASALNAQTTTVGYLQQTRRTKPNIPISPGWVGAGYYGPFNLPGYGDVWVNVSPDPGYLAVPKLTWGHEIPAQFQKTSNSKYDWGTDTDFFDFYNTSATGTADHYTITFYFAGPNGMPNPSDLFLVVSGLASGTTATVSPRGGTNVGEYTLPGTSTTVFDSGTGTFKSRGNGDPFNTGWDLYRPNSPNLSSLSLHVTHKWGDGIGFTLGYRVCTTLVGNT